MKKLESLSILVIIVLTIISGNILIKRYEQSKEVSQIKLNIENMLKNNTNMKTIKKGRINTLTIENDKVVIYQDIKGSNYKITLNKKYDNIKELILMYMTGYQPFNKNIKDVQVFFNY